MKIRKLSAVVLFLFVTGALAIAGDTVSQKADAMKNTMEQKAKKGKFVTKELKVIEYDANATLSKKSDSTDNSKQKK